LDGFLFSLLPALLILGILIFIHELGHFIACRAVGVSVERFSIGFGPEIFHFNWKETRISLSIIPFGGFVKPKGESSEELKGRTPEPDEYLAKGRGARALIVSAGVIMNFILAFVIFVAVYVMGRPVLEPVVGELVEDYPAKQAGVLPGDRVLSVDGKEVKDWNTLTFAILTHSEGPMNLEIERNGSLAFIQVVPQQEEVEIEGQGTRKLKRIGIRPSGDVHIEKLSFLPAILEGGSTTIGFTMLTYRVLWGLLTGEVSFRNIAGPVGIVAITGRTAKQGFVSLLQLTAILSINLGVINLLPIPALDGGHLFFILIETIRRKAVSQRVQERLTQAGFVALMALMVFIVFNDLQNLGLFSKMMGGGGN